MSRRRDNRESQALKFLRRRGSSAASAHEPGSAAASACELGSAAIAGELEHGRTVFRERLGFKIGLHFVKRGIARVTRDNRFEWVPPAT